MGLRLTKPKPDARQVPARVARMSDHDLVEWADVTAMQIHALIDRWRFKSGTIAEVKEAVGTLEDILTEAMNRPNLNP